MSSSSLSSPRHRNSSALPPPPNVTPQKQHQQHKATMDFGATNGTTTNGNGVGSNSNYAQNLARSMTIDEMRTLHRRALNDAEAKQTELRLVLASRYRELVGSSDEVTKMRERAQELDELVSALPNLMGKLLKESTTATTTATATTTSTIAEEEEGVDADRKKEEEAKAESPGNDDKDDGAVLRLRQFLSCLPRMVHRSLDKSNVYEATEYLMELFRLIAEQTDEYPLATALSLASSSSSSSYSSGTSLMQRDILLQSQTRMTFMHVQTLPVKIIRIAKRILHSAASFSSSHSYAHTHSSSEREREHKDDSEAVVPLDPKYGAQRSAAALSALDMLTIKQHQQSHSSSRPVELLDMYFDAKAELLQSLLDQLNNTSNGKKDSGDHAMGSNNGGDTNNAEEILSKIVLILQYDIVLHPYQIFVLRQFPTKSSDTDKMMKSLPMFPAAIVQAKASNFLSAHLPLIRTKVKNVLVDIAGTTASALGKIRQSLYDKTDGVECTEKVDDSDGICTWDEAVSGVVDVPSVLIGIGGVGVGPAPIESSSSSTLASTSNDRKFSLWGVLFSNTFSSLVHSLLTSSFQSVHTKLVSTLRLSLTNAPPLKSILPHEAYRNTLNIASQLDSALLKVSDDAHELLVHAEERVESERRLRQSLYVQTCEIMGRLICELRRMLLTTNTNKSDNYDAVKQLIVGRLCHLLKFRLTALSTLLDPNSSPAVLHRGGGMISIMELSSAFELADDNDDGLITFQEAMEAVDSAFSGTHFHGAEMVRETLLLPAVGRDKSTPATDSGVGDSKAVVTPHDVTLDELTLLLARGLQHDKSGGHSALGAIQNSLDRMVKSSFQNWAKGVLQPYSTSLSDHTKQSIDAACSSSEEEFQRLYTSSEVASSSLSSSKSAGVVTNVSPHLTSYLINISFALNRSVCPSDSLLPVPYKEFAVAMGVNDTEIPRMIDTIRCALLREGLEAVMCILGKHVGTALDGTTAPLLKESGPSGIAQLKNDLSFLQTCFFERNQHGFGIDESMENSKLELQSIIRKTDILFRRACNSNTVREIEGKQEYLFETCDLFVSSLFGKDKTSSAAVPMSDLGVASSDMLPQMGGKTPLFHPPLVSSCRFPLLPIQADRTLSGVQARGKYKEKEENESNSERMGSGAVRASFGFFSSMLKTS
mmetsp:Transcript_8617/g.16665  ORF Transcript_8617/g.16665 Transcript_8617/m.16665 type:complete len:1162 (-) Transcript_8617:3746-7231(-)